MQRLFPNLLFALVMGLLAACGTSLGADEYLARGEAFAADGKYREARVELRNAIAQNPNLPQARLLLGEMQLKLGDSQAAVREFERALDLGIEGDRVALGLNLAKVRVGRYNEVLGDLGERTDLAPEFAAVLGEAWLGTGDLGKARASFEKAGSIAPGLAGLGAVAAAQGDAAAAREYFDKALSIDPADAETWLRKGDLEMSERQPVEAEAAYRSAMTLPAGEIMGQLGLARAELAAGKLDEAKANAKGVLGAAPNFPGAHYLLAMVLLEQKDFAAAEQQLDETRQQAPDFAAIDYLLAMVKYRSGDLDAAMSLVKRYLKREPRNPDGLKMLASLLIDKGDFEGAASHLEDVAETSDDAQLIALYGTAQLRLGQATKATEAFGRAAELEPDIGQFRGQLALSLMSAGEPDRAEEALSAGADVSGSQFENDYLLAMIHLQQRDWSKAQAVIERLAAADPTGPIPDQLRGVAQQLAGEDDRGEAAFRSALAKDPTFLPAIQTLALMRYLRGDEPGAKQLFEDLLEREPDNVDALTGLAELALRDKDTGVATGYLERAVVADPGAIRPSIALARIYAGDQRNHDAARVVSKGLERFPNSPDLLALDAELAIAAGDVESARASLAKLQARARRDVNNAALQATVGNLELLLGQGTLARISLERAAAAGGRPGVQARLGLARLALLERDAARARQLLAEIEKDGSTGPDLELLRADILVAENRQDDVIVIYRDLMERGVREGFMRQAALQLASGDPRASVSTYQAWLERAPGDDRTRLQLANALMQFDPKAAIHEYERLRPTGNAIALNNLAWLYMEAGDDRAVATAREALDAAPDHPDVMDTAGWILLKAGERAEALRLLKRSAELNPKQPSILYHLGIALRETGDHKGARERLGQALAAGEFPEKRDARAALDGLGGG